MNETKPAILYARYSPRPDAETSNSESIQFAEMREFCAEQGYTILRELSDRGLSGNDADRPGFREALCELKKGYTLIAMRPERLARDAYLMSLAFHEAKRRGANIKFVYGDTEDTPEGRLLREILASVAGFERSMISWRTSLACKRLRDEGRDLFRGRPPFGRMCDPARPGWTIENPAEVAAMRRIRELSDEGMGVRRIVAALNAEGIPPRGKAWYRTSVMRLLRLMEEQDRRARK